jgi:ABC-type amino acid transport substrate-binding protein
MVSVMSLIAVALLTAAALSRQLRWQAGRALPKAALAVAATAVTVLAVRVVLAATIDTSYHKDEQLRAMHLSRSPVPARVLADAPPPDAAPGSALQRIRARGVLRVGFVPDRVPFSFVNARGDLVGMDIELAEALARDLGLERVEFVPADFDGMRHLVVEGRIDLGMGMPYVGAALADVSYSAAYLDGTLGLLVRDTDRDTFSSVDALRERRQVTIGLVYATPGIEDLLRASLPGINLRFVALASPRDWVDGGASGVDAVAMLAEAGAAWSILHPAYSVVVPRPDPVEVPVGIALRRGDRDLHDFVDDWLVVMRSTGALRHAREYWVLGRGAQAKRPRWSVMDDLLGWGDRAAAPAQMSR